MTCGTCKTCAHWTCGGARLGICDQLYIFRGIKYTTVDDRDPLHAADSNASTPETFGCIHHEVKNLKENPH